MFSFPPPSSLLHRFHLTRQPSLLSSFLFFLTPRYRVAVFRWTPLPDLPFLFSTATPRIPSHPPLDKISATVPTLGTTATLLSASFSCLLGHPSVQPSVGQALPVRSQWRLPPRQTLAAVSLSALVARKTRSVNAAGAIPARFGKRTPPPVTTLLRATPHPAAVPSFVQRTHPCTCTSPDEGSWTEVWRATSADYWIGCLSEAEQGNPGDVEKGSLRGGLLVKVRTMGSVMSNFLNSLSTFSRPTRRRKHREHFPPLMGTFPGWYFRGLQLRVPPHPARHDEVCSRFCDDNARLPAHPTRPDGYS